MNLRFSLLFITSASLFLSSCSPPSFPGEVERKESIIAASKCLRERYGLHIVANSLGDVVDSSEALWGVTFMSRSKYTLEESRTVGLEMMSCLLQNMYTDPHFAQGWYSSCYFLQENLQMYNGSLAFKITFWDEHMDRPLYPYIAQVRYVNNALYYSYADPETQCLQDPIIEKLSVEP